MRRPPLPIAALALALAVALAAAPAPAIAAEGDRGGASLRVLVLDPSGAAVPGATVSVAAGGESRRALTDPAGVASFDALPRGRAVARAVLEGFDPREKGLTLRAGANESTITLALAKRTEEVSVVPDERARASQGFGTVLTADEIAALPDDPEEMEEALRRMAGPDAVLRVNGFSGGRLPPKSQIRQIRIQMNPYSAEFHEAGHGRIDVLTKPGLGPWRTGARSSLRNAALNARPPLAPEQPADSYYRYGFSLQGPLQQGRTSLSLSVDGRSNDGARTIRATLPDGPLSRLAPQGSDKLDVQGRVEHAWGASHTLRAEYQRLRHDQTGLAASGLDLAERAYTQSEGEHLARFSDSGTLGGRAATETLLELRWARTDYTPSSLVPGILVPGAFSGGGAQIEGSRRSRSLSLTQNFDWGAGRHAFRAGFRLEAERFESAERRNARGTFTFPSLDAYGAGRPSLFTQQTGDPRVAFDHAQLGAYVQDEIKLGRNATLSLGVRNEAQSAVDGAFHPAPRASLAYGLDGRTTLRLGAGLFREWLGAAARAETLRLDGRHALERAVANPGSPDVPPMDAGAATIASRYLPLGSLGLPRIDRVSAGLERAVGEGLRLRLDASVERGRGALRTVNRNFPGAGTGRPDPGAGNELELVADGRSRRHTLWVSGSYMKPGAAASGFVSYVLADARNDGEVLAVPATAAGLGGEWGPALTDVRHRLFGFGRARLGKGLSVSGLLRLESGSPYTVTTGRDHNGDSILNDRPAGASRNAGRGEARFSLDLRVSWSRGFGPDRQPTGPTAHVVRLGDGEGPPDMPGPDANRRFVFSAYVQAFNATNHTNPRAYVSVLGAPAFGQPLLAEPGRRVEMGASFTF